MIAGGMPEQREFEGPAGTSRAGPSASGAIRLTMQCSLPFSASI